MDYEQLKTFMTIADLNSFTKTAAFLHITQSTVTSRIKKMEEFYGTSLFDRHNRDIRLSEKGAELLPLFKQQLELYEKTKQVALQKESAYELKISVTQSTWESFPVRKIHRLYEKFPDLHIRLFTDHSPNIVQQILNGTIDYGIIYNLPSTQAIKSWHLGRDHYHLYRHRDLELEADFELRQLVNYPWIQVRWGYPFIKWMEKQDIHHLKPPLEVSHGGLALQLLHEQKGIAFLSKESIERSKASDELVEVPIAGSLPYQDYYAICLKNHPQTRVHQAMDRFLQNISKKKHP